MNSTARQSDKTVVRAKGILEGCQVDGFKVALARAVEAGGHVVVDLSAMEMLARDAMTALTEAENALERAGATLLIMNPSVPVSRVMDFRKIQEHLGPDPMHEPKTDGRVAVEV